MRADIATEKRDTRPGIRFGIGGGQWEQYFVDSPEQLNDFEEEEKYTQVGSSSSIGQEEVQFISIRYSRDSYIRFSPILTLRDLDEAMFLPLLNESLARRVKAIHVFANEYKLMELSHGISHTDSTAFEPNVPAAFTSEELADPWVRIRPRNASAFHLRFSDETPQRMFAPKKIQDSLPKLRAEKKANDGQ